MDSPKTFTKVEVIKKANISSSNIMNPQTKSNQKTKKFSYLGRKIDPNSKSQPTLNQEKNTLCDNNNNNMNYNEYKKPSLQKNQSIEVMSSSDRNELPTQKTHRKFCPADGPLVINRQKRSFSNADQVTNSDKILHSVTAETSGFSSPKQNAKHGEEKEKIEIQNDEDLLISPEVQQEYKTPQRKISTVRHYGDDVIPIIQALESSKARRRKSSVQATPYKRVGLILLRSDLLVVFLL